MTIPQLRKCCCVFSLQAATKIIGWLHLVLSLIALIVVAKSLGAGRYIPTETSEGIVILENTAFNYLIVVCAGSVIAALISILLIIGAYNRNPGKLLIWVLYTSIASVVYLMGILYGSWMMLSAGATGAGLGNLFGGLFVLAIEVYLLFVVHSYRRELQLNNRIPKTNF